MAFKTILIDALLSFRGKKVTKQLVIKTIMKVLQTKQITQSIKLFLQPENPQK